MHPIQEDRQEAAPNSRHGNSTQNGAQAELIERDVRQRIQILLDSAPSDSSAVFVIRRKDEGFKALLKVRSRSGYFAAGGQKNDLSLLIDDVTNQIWQQIRHWRETRGELA